MVFAILSLVFSIVSIFAFWWLSFIGFAFGIAGIVTAFKDNKTNNIQFGLSIAGTVIGFICIIIILLALA